MLGNCAKCLCNDFGEYSISFLKLLQKKAGVQLAFLLLLADFGNYDIT